MVTNHQALKWFMQSNWLIRKLTKWVPIFQEYDYDVTHCIGINNKNVNGLNWNPSSNELDTTRGMLAWGNELEIVVLGWHVVSFFYIVANGY